ncbi:MAG: WG repeat-containing protein, partial [Methanobacterium sp.]
ARQICDILGYLHMQNPPIIFRDLKPANIMLTPQGQIKLIDFGIARHFRHGITADTSAYGSSGFAAPEQYGENQTDPRSDIYALGATLHYLLTCIDPSKTPFTFDPPSQYAKVSPRLETIIMKALELRSENRPNDVREMLDLLTKCSPASSNSPLKQNPVFNNKEETKVNKNNPADLLVTAPKALSGQMKTNKMKPGENKTVVLDHHGNPLTGQYEQNVVNPYAQPIKNKTQKSMATNKKVNKKRNILITVCLAIVLMAGCVYGFNHYILNKENSHFNTISNTDLNAGKENNNDKNQNKTDEKSEAKSLEVSTTDTSTANSNDKIQPQQITNTADDTNDSNSENVDVRNQPQFRRALEFREGLAAVMMVDSGKWGFIDTKGKMVIQPQYTDVGGFSEGLSWVRIGEYGNSSCGYIDKTGKLVIQPQYDYAGGFTNGQAIVQFYENGKFIERHIDKNGRKIIDDISNNY